jgi:leucyl-tRNA synthetase
MELVNVLTNHQSLITNHELGILAKLLAPFAPHMTEELWVEVLHMPFSIHKTPWPSYEAKYITEKEATVVVQINGKVRGQMVVESKMANDKLQMENLAKAEPNVAKWLEGKTIKKVVFVPGKLINFVV